MRIVDRYLLWQFLKAFLVFFIAFAGLFVVIDAVGNLDEFLSYAKQGDGLFSVLSGYYGARVLAVFDRTSGVLTLVAAMFTVTALERHNELTALMAAGISKARIIRPILAAVVAVSLLAAAGRELVIPSFQGRLTRNAQDWLGERARPVQARYDHQTGIFLAGNSAYANERRIENADFLLPAALGAFGRQLVANSAFYRPARDGRPAGYLLKGVEKPARLDRLPSAFYDGRPVLLTAADTPWLADGECFVVSGVTFDQLAGAANWWQYASTAELVRSLHNPSSDFGAGIRVAIHSRLLRPVLDVTLLFLGLPLVLRQEKRNIFVAIGICLLVVAGFFAVTLAFQSLGTNCLISPALAAWCPLAIFIPLAVILSEPLRESSKPLTVETP